MKPVHIGCSGWVYRDWRGAFYPEKLPQRDWLAHYASRFRTVEVNNTFYRLPSTDAVVRWVEQTPEGFVFAVKGSRYITHIKRLTGLDRYLDRFFERIAPLAEAGRLGPVLWQLPGNFKRDDERLRAATRALASRPGMHSFEFRHPSWFADEPLAILQEAGMALVIGDDPERPFGARKLTAEWTYVRLHRGSRGRRGRYSDAELDTWRRRIAAWRSRSEAFVYLNNDWEAFAVQNARYLSRSLS